MQQSQVHSRGRPLSTPPPGRPHQHNPGVSIAQGCPTRVLIDFTRSPLPAVPPSRRSRLPETPQGFAARRESLLRDMQLAIHAQACRVSPTASCTAPEQANLPLAPTIAGRRCLPHVYGVARNPLLAARSARRRPQRRLSPPSRRCASGRAGAREPGRRGGRHRLQPPVQQVGAAGSRAVPAEGLVSRHSLQLSALLPVACRRCLAVCRPTAFLSTGGMPLLPLRVFCSQFMGVLRDSLARQGSESLMRNAQAEGPRCAADVDVLPGLRLVVCPASCCRCCPLAAVHPLLSHVCAAA